LRQALGNVVIRVLDFPDDETLEEMDCESPFDLLGLYRGVNLLHKSNYDTPDDLETKAEGTRLSITSIIGSHWRKAFITIRGCL
jgi:hypothetical protein